MRAGSVRQFVGDTSDSLFMVRLYGVYHLDIEVTFGDHAPLCKKLYLRLVELGLHIFIHFFTLVIKDELIHPLWNIDFC
jgi:hypothetical protein